MAALNESIKLFIVGRLACYDSPGEIQKALKEEHGITAGRSQVQAYDPTTAQGSRLSPKLREVFESTRKRFLAEITDVPIANKAVRMRLLQRMVDRAVDKGNAAMASSLLEQAAKEVGDAFTNRQKVEQSGVVGSVPIAPPAAGSQTAEEAYRAMLGGPKA